ncbi:EF-hand domain-containing protein [Rhizobium sp. GCM10022189]|uniref:EF-hand domain-containing protein n=1 Tax=Rhizobium sp. GCM10022189 TaxID=3252654 RepID=UPI0036155AB7
MTTATDTSPLTQVLNKVFTKFDRNGDNKLTGQELENFDQILMPGVAVDDNGRPKVDMKQRLDHDANGAVGRDEMHSTGILMPAEMTDPSLTSLLNYLHAKNDPAALQAAAILELDDSTES